MSRAGEIVAFWRQAGPDLWFAADAAFDAACRAGFRADCEAAASGLLADWEETPEGALALVLLLDQFPRNLHRGTARAFATDEAARGAAERAIARGHDRALDEEMRRFLYMPFMHAEDLAAQERGVALFAMLEDPEPVRYARQHRDIVARFGRFPHRNAALGRKTTAEEAAYLASEDAFRG